MVTVKCYGKERQYETKEQAMAEFINNLACSEGSEQGRYASIVAQLYEGKTYCTDEE